MAVVWLTLIAAPLGAPVAEEATVARAGAAAQAVLAGGRFQRRLPVASPEDAPSMPRLRSRPLVEACDPRPLRRRELLQFLSHSAKMVSRERSKPWCAIHWKRLHTAIKDQLVDRQAPFVQSYFEFVHEFARKSWARSPWGRSGTRV